MIKSIILFGSNGMLGNYIYSYFKNKYKMISLIRKDYDIENLNIDSLELLLVSKKINNETLIINCAGVIPQRNNDNYNKYIKVNTLFPIFLSNISEKYKSKFIHITTDCVFSGKKGNYTENDIKDETNIYGVSKSLGELFNGTIIRTSIIGEEKYNKKSLLEWIISKKNSKINGYSNHYWNGVTCLQLSEIINSIIINNYYWKGVRHIFSPKSVSKYELVNMINNIYNLNITINKYSAEK